MYIHHIRQRREAKEYKAAITVTIVLLSLAVAMPLAQAQSLVTTITLGRDQIGQVRTAQGISTRVSFPDTVQEIICGDLYDPNSGKGSFVIMRSGKDVFIKPVAPIGVSNMFVKVGESGEYVYNFDLAIVKVSQAHRVVNVIKALNAPTNGKHPSRGMRPFKSPPTLARINMSDDKLHELPPRLNDSPDALTWAGAEPAPPPPNTEPRLLKSPPLIAHIDAGGGEFNRPKLAIAELPDASASLKAEPAPPPPVMKAESGNALRERAAKPVALQGEPIKRVRPEYPESASATGVTGEVEVEILVNESGKVISAKAISGPILLRQAAIHAARGWRFLPTEIDGVPVQATGRIKFVFTRPSTSSHALNVGEFVGGSPGRRPRP